MNTLIKDFLFSFPYTQKLKPYRTTLRNHRSTKGVILGQTLTIGKDTESQTMDGLKNGLT